MIGCKKKDSLSVLSVDSTAIPTSHAEEISMLISDSGITRYRMNADIWDVFSNAKDPFWHFPEGIYIEQFDSLFNTDASIKADTAYFYSDKELWHLIGNVFVTNHEGHKFETEELFWDRKEPANSMNSIHTDKPVKIDQNGDVLYSRYGMRANQRMTILEFKKSSAEFFLEEKPSSPDSIFLTADTITTPQIENNEL